MEKVIKKADNFFKLDTRKIIKNVSYLLGSQLFGNVLSFTVALAAAHFLSKETYGTYRYILSTIGFITAFSLTGLSTAIVRSVARGYDYLFTTSFIKSLTWSIPSIIISIGVGFWYILNQNMVLGFGVLIGGIIFPFVQALLWYRSYLNGKNYFQDLMKANIAYSFITSGIILITIFLKPSTLLLVIAYYISNVISTAIIAFIIRRKHPPNLLQDPDHGHLEKHMSLMNILDIGATHLDKIIIFQVAGPVEVARYSFAVLIPEQLRNILKYASTLAMPKFATLSKDISKKKGIELVWKLLLITVPLVIVYIISTPLIYKIFFPTYVEVILFSQLFSIILIFDGGISGTLLRAHNQIKSLYWVNISSNIIKITLLILFGIFWGIWGIIASRIISRLISFVLSYLLVLRMKTSAF